MQRKLWLYILFTFGISWLLPLFYWLAGGSASPTSISFFIMVLAFMFTPMIATIIVYKFFYNEELKRNLNIYFIWNKWYWVAWLLPLVLTFATMGVSLLFPSVEFSPGMEGMFGRFEGILSPAEMQEMREMELPIHPAILSIFQALIAALTINAVAGFGEELGWRGLMYKNLSNKNFWEASLIIGFVWGVWHAPIILMGHNYPDHPEYGVIMMIVFCLLFSPLFTLIRLKSGSVIAASILHGSINAFGGIAILLIRGGNDLLVGFTGLAGFIVLVFINLWIFFTYPQLLKTPLHIVEEF